MTKKSINKGLAYLGGGSLHGVPARDLSAEEVERYGDAYRAELVHSAQAAVEDCIRRSTEPDKNTQKALEADVRARKQLTPAAALMSSGLYGQAPVATAATQEASNE